MANTSAVNETGKLLSRRAGKKMVANLFSLKAAFVTRRDIHPPAHPNGQMHDQMAVILDPEGIPLGLAKMKA